MPRLPRNIELDHEGQYHLRGQVIGPVGYYPLQVPENAAELQSTIRWYTSHYFCQVASLSILGNHYHLVCRFEAFQQLSRTELWERAERLYPIPSYQPHRNWGEADWERFNRRLFNVSELMRNIQSRYAVWFNQKYGRKGPFWAGRFGMTESDDLLETAYYVDLNPVRAHLTTRPEAWRYGSGWLRRHGQDDWLMPLEELMGLSGRPTEAARRYWTGLYWRGTRPSKLGDGVIPQSLAEEMERQGCPRGCYLESIPAFSRGRVIGRQAMVQKAIDRHRADGLYHRRRNPVPLGVAHLFALREQRRNYVSI